MTDQESLELVVEERCNWCEPQQCFTASLWYGDVLMSFYTLDKTRLEEVPLKVEARKALTSITQALKPEATEIIGPRELWAAVSNAGCLTCFWEDFVPPLAIVGCNYRIPLSEAK